MRVMAQPLSLAAGPVLIFGGPYSNLAATRAMQAEAAVRGIPTCNCICTGDVVAYCAQPEETTQLIRDWGIPVVMGNCEESLGAGADDCGCGFEEGSACSVLAIDWYTYANARVSVESRAWMRTLPHALTFVWQGKRFRVIHGGVEQVNRFIFPSTAHEVKAFELDAADADVVIGGHSGIPFGEKLGRGVWLNAGVIGLPANDGTQDGWYLLLTPTQTGVTVTWHRLHYEPAQEAEVMHGAGLDNGYAQALLSGLWPSMDVLPATERAQQGKRLAIEPLVIR